METGIYGRTATLACITDRFPLLKWGFLGFLGVFHITRA
jgi:hypothetical protein